MNDKEYAVEPRRDTQEFIDSATLTTQSAESLENEAMVVELARCIARVAHSGQVDKSGVDYIEHPAAVAKEFEMKGEGKRAAAAWLHDVVEDSSITIEGLLAIGVPLEVVEIVDLLTRKDDVPDDEYYRRIAANPDALAVKLADIRHNTRLDRQTLLEEHAKTRLTKKYIHAAEMLGQNDFANELRGRLL